jgi:hypothetical protein
MHKRNTNSVFDTQKTLAAVSQTRTRGDRIKDIRDHLETFNDQTRPEEGAIVVRHRFFLAKDSVLG